MELLRPPLPRPHPQALAAAEPPVDLEDRPSAAYQMSGAGHVEARLPEDAVAYGLVSARGRAGRAGGGGVGGVSGMGCGCGFCFWGARCDGGRRVRVHSSAVHHI
jgi:hypothetical protein